MIKVVQNDSKVPAGLYGDYLDRQGLSWELLPLDRDIPFPAPAAGDALIVLGGYMSAHDTGRYPYLRQVKAGLRRWVEAERPVLGVCLGDNCWPMRWGALSPATAAANEACCRSI